MDAYKSAVEKEAMGTSLTAKEKEFLVKVDDLQRAVDKRTSGAAPGSAGAGSSGLSVEAKRKRPGALVGFPREKWLQDKGELLGACGMPSFGKTFLERDPTGRPKKGVEHEGHTAQARRLHEVAVCPAAIEKLIPPVESAEAVALFQDPQAMREKLVEAREIAEDGMSLIMSQSHWLCLLNKHGYQKASAVIGDDMGLPADQAKRARKLDEAEALAREKSQGGSGGNSRTPKRGGRGNSRFVPDTGQPYPAFGQ